MQKRPIYLDYAATTPVDPRVLKAMLPYFGTQLITNNQQLITGLWGNPGSLHSFGQRASAAVFNARQTIAQAIGAHYSEIIFTGSATEANNLALRGSIRAHQRITNQNPNKRIKPRILISAVEHESILEAAQDLARDGVEIVIIPVSKDGVIDLKAFKKLLNDRTVLVSVMYANNEIGTIQPISEIAEIIRQFRESAVSRQLSAVRKAYPLFHADAVQAFNYLPCDVSELGVDLMTLSAQKIYGPKGIGALYVRRTTDNKQLTADQRSQGSSVKGQVYNYRLEPIIVGGGQEGGLRSGTENVPAIVGFAKAMELASAFRDKEAKRLKILRDELLKGIKKIWPSVQVNGTLKERLPNHLNIYLPKQKVEQVLVALDLMGITISSGSACSARSPEPSKVLLALGATKDRAKNSVRITLGRPTTKKDIDVLLAALVKIKSFGGVQDK